jgi:hypothetical protein
MMCISKGKMTETKLKIYNAVALPIYGTGVSEALVMEK